MQVRYKVCVCGSGIHHGGCFMKKNAKDNDKFTLGNLRINMIGCYYVCAIMISVKP